MWQENFYFYMHKTNIMFYRLHLFAFYLSFSISLFGQGNIFVVTNTLDAGEGSFRQAVDNARSAGEDTIVFEISTADPGFDSTIGVWSIESSMTYQIPAGTVIYGAYAFGAEDDSRPGIEIHGTDSSITSGLTGLRLQSNVVLRGLTVNRFQYGIWVQSSDCTIEHCIIGTDPTGITSRANGANGILLANGASNNLVQNNLVSGNGSAGIRLFGEETTNNTMIGNFIGTNRQGTEGLPNGGSGIQLHVGAHANFIIENIISGNGQFGLWLTDSGTSGNIIQDNRIGTDVSGTLGIPNESFGVALFNGPSNNIIGPGNRVAYNRDDGILVDGTDMSATVGNRITTNSISDNERKGINNFRSGNNELSAPTIDSIVSNIVYGSAMSGQIAELFFDTRDEGCCFVGLDTVNMTGIFQITLPDSFPDLPFLTATTTDPLGNTSEFSDPYCIESPKYLFDGAAFCMGMDLELSAGVFESYQWSTGATTEVITVQTAGTYKVTVTDSRGCMGSDSVFVIEYPTPSLAIEMLATDCANMILAAGDYDSYLWSTGDSTASITTTLAGIYTVMVTDSNGCNASDTVMVDHDPLSLPWVQALINNPFNPYCNECLTLSQATWMETDVIIFDWDAGSCNFTDLGFTTIYNCEGDTIQHCYTSIAGVHCDPDALIMNEDLQNEKLLWQCTPISLPDCPTDSTSILALPWLVDTLLFYEDLCELACIGSNSGNFLYKHNLDTNVILELRTTCADVIRRFYDCQGKLIYSCTSFSESGLVTCDLPFLPPQEGGELIWQCPSTTSSTLLSENHSIKLYPTVFTNYIRIETKMEVPVKIIFYDGLGRVLSSMSGYYSNEEVDTHNWPQGIIYANTISQNRSKLVKVFKIE